MKDKRGTEVDTESFECVAVIDEFIDNFLAYRRSNYNIAQRAVEADGGCAMAHLIAVVARVFCETDHQEQADCHMQLARGILDAKHADLQGNRSSDKSFKRSSLWFEALSFLRRGLVESSIEKHLEIAREFPSDVMSVKLCQILFLNLGDKEGILNVAQKAIDRDPLVLNDHFFRGLFAFGLVECNRFDEALEQGLLGVEMAPNRCDPWSQHSVAHVYDQKGEMDKGIEWMERHTDTWELCNSFMYTHNWWHTALFYLEKGQSDRTLELYDNHVWGFRKEHTQDQIGATSLLWRCDLKGIDVVERYEDVSSYISPLATQHVQPFIDMHFVYALTKAGKHDRVEELIKTLEESSATDASVGCFRDQRRISISALKAVREHASGRNEAAFEHLNPVVDRLKELGGSNAQQDVFAQMYVDILIKTGKWEKAHEVVSQRHKARQTPHSSKQLELILQNLCSLPTNL